MIGRPVKIRQVVNKAQIRKLSIAVHGEGARGGFSSWVCGTGSYCRRRPAGAYGRLIEVHHAREFHAMIADVCGIERELAGERVLNAQGPVLDVGCAEVAIHRKRVAGTRSIAAGVESYAVAAFGNCADNAWRIDCRGLIHPVKVRAGDRDTRGDDLSDASTAGWACAGRV